MRQSGGLRLSGFGREDRRESLEYPFNCRYGIRGMKIREHMGRDLFERRARGAQQFRGRAVALAAAPTGRTPRYACHLDACRYAIKRFRGLYHGNARGIKEAWD
jgi:hypothetical protein